MIHFLFRYLREWSCCAGGPDLLCFRLDYMVPASSRELLCMRTPFLLACPPIGENSACSLRKCFLLDVFISPQMSYMLAFASPNLNNIVAASSTLSSSTSKIAHTFSFLDFIALISSVASHWDLAVAKVTPYLVGKLNPSTLMPQRMTASYL